MDVNQILNNEEFDLGALSIEATNELLGAIDALPQNKRAWAMKKMWNKKVPVSL